MISKDNKFLISGSTDKSIKVFDLRTKELVHEFLDIHEGGIRSIAISDNNEYLVSGSYDKSIKLIEFNHKVELYHFQRAHEGF